MKNISGKISTCLIVVAFLVGCKKNAELTYLDVVTFPPSLTVSTRAISLSAANNDSSVVTFSWPTVSFKIKGPITYSLQLDLPADTLGTTAWGKAIKMEIGKDVLAKSFKGSDINTIALQGLNLPKDSVNTVVARVVAYLDRSVFSNAVSFTIKPFAVPVLNVLYIPGEYQGWDPGTAPVIAEVTGRPKMYEAYAYMPGSGPKYFKFTNARDWNHINYGDGGGGTFSIDGAAGGLSVPDGGYYELTANLITNKWTVTKTTWSIIGDATPGGWGNDTQLTYDAAAQVWKVTANMVQAGSFKFRANNAWTIDFGVDNNGKLVYADNPFLGYTGGLNNLSVPSDGNYTITLDLHNSGNYTYILKKN
ncbi:MAG: SusE domain-containing protein [Chitinophagaceae bacterium]